MEWMTLILDFLFMIESMFTHNIIRFRLNREEGDLILHTQEQVVKILFPKYSLVHCSKKKEGLERHSSMT